MVSPLVSVLIPTYNDIEYIGEAIDSVFKQHYPKDRIQLIIVDDGSDNTEEYVHNIHCRISEAACYSKEPLYDIKVLTKDNGGSASARNFGLDYCEGEFIQLLDADDILLEDKISLGVREMQKDESIGVVYSYYFQFGNEEDDEVFVDRRPFSIEAQANECIITTAALLRKIYVTAVGGWNEEFKYIEDYEIGCKLSMVCKVQCLELPLFKYRMQGQNKTNSVLRKERWHREHAWVKSKMAKELGKWNSPRLAVCMAGGIGDLVAISSVYSLFKIWFPDASLVHYCYDSPFYDVIEHNPYINIKHHGGNLIDMLNDAKKRYEPDGYRVLTTDYFYRYGWNFWKTDLNLMQFFSNDIFGINFELEEYAPEFYYNPDGSDFKKPDKLISELGKYIVVESQTRSNQEGKQWDGFSDVYRHLDDLGVNIVSVASKDVDPIEGKNVTNIRDFTIRESARVIEKANLVITSQSGLSWIADAFEKPGVMINAGAPSTYVGRTMGDVSIVDQEQPFSPQTIKLEDVISAIDKKVEEYL